MHLFLVQIAAPVSQNDQAAVRALSVRASEGGLMQCNKSLRNLAGELNFMSRQQPKGGDPVSHCHMPWSSAAGIWTLVRVESCPA
jgi:hypothetical protein